MSTDGLGSASSDTGLPAAASRPAPYIVREDIFEELRKMHRGTDEYSSLKSPNEVLLPNSGSSLSSPGMVEVNVNEATGVDQALEDAISQVTGAAVRHQTGVLVTSIGQGRYIVRAHPAVPVGLIRQQQK